MKIEALKEYIRQEIKKVIKEELKNYLFEVLNPNGVNFKLEKKSSLIDESNNSNSEPQAPKKFVNYTKNEALNKVLNETVGGVPREGSYVGLSGGDFDTGPSESLNEVAVPESAPQPVKTVVSAMNRDYRSLLKAVDKKRSGKV